MVAEVRTDTQEARDLVAPTQILDLEVERQIGQSIRVVGEEHLLADEVVLHGLESLTDVRVQPRLNEGDPPIRDVAGVQQLPLAPALRQDKVVGDALLVVEEVLLNQVAPIPE